MQSITELAATRQAVRGAVQREDDDDAAQRLMAELYLNEAAILATPLETRDDKLTARAILYEDGDVDFADTFIERLALRLLDAI